MEGDFDKCDLTKAAARLIIEEALETAVTEVLRRGCYTHVAKMARVLPVLGVHHRVKGISAG